MANPPPPEKDALVALRQAEHEIRTVALVDWNMSGGSPRREAVIRWHEAITAAISLLTGASGGAEQCSLEDDCPCSACVRERSYLGPQGTLKLTRYGRAAYEVGRLAGGAGEAQPGDRALCECGHRDTLHAFGTGDCRFDTCPCQEWKRPAPAPAPVREPEPPLHGRCPAMMDNDWCEKPFGHPGPHQAVGAVWNRQPSPEPPAER